MLSYPERYKDSWKKLGLTKQSWLFFSTPDLDRIKKIKNSIEKVFVVSPLLKLRSALQYSVGRFLAPIAELAIHTFSSYSMWSAQPIDLLTEMTTKDLKIDFFLTPEDNNVSPYQQEPLQDLVKTMNGAWTMEVKNEHHCDTDPAANALEAYLKTTQ
jgi:hypothetical protein